MNKFCYTVDAALNLKSVKNSKEKMISLIFLIIRNKKNRNKPLNKQFYLFKILIHFSKLPVRNAPTIETIIIYLQK